MDKNERVMIVFDQQCSPYQTGERAAFLPKAAEKLVSSGTAHYATAEDDETVEDSNADEQVDVDGEEQPKRARKGSGKGKKGKSSDKPAGKRKRKRAE